MFSGLVEQKSWAIDIQSQTDLLRLILKRPSSYDSLQEGESICVDGVCLTLEKFDKDTMSFVLAPETLKITNWTLEKLKNKKFNLERSLTLQSAVGGQVLTGHVDALALVKKTKRKGDSLIVQVEIPKEFKSFFSKKGYIALSGVSLTINEVKNRVLELCLIPKTLELTNLSDIKQGDFLNFEVDYMSRSFVHNFKSFYRKFMLIFCFAFLLLFIPLIVLLLAHF